MSDPLGALRHLLARLAPGQAAGGAATPRPAEEAPPNFEEREVRPLERDLAPRKPEPGEVRELPLSLRGGQGGGEPAPRGREREPSPPPQLARGVMAYLNARAEEALALVLEELSRETARDLSEALEETRQTISADLEGVRDSVLSSQREFSRIGRELVRSGATLESIQAAVSALGPAVERTAESLRAELMQEHARERRLREEAERAALDDMLATLDGLEVGLEAGRELVRALAETQRQLKDTTVHRWWRAMGEATGVKRPLPTVPLADVEGWIGGLELTHRRLQDALARRGVTPIEAAGRPFDPYLHEAVAVEPCPADQDGLVLREERRGYRTADRVLRLAQVVVGRVEPPKAPTGRRRPSRSTEEPPDGDQESATTDGSLRTEPDKESATTGGSPPTEPQESAAGGEPRLNQP